MLVERIKELLNSSESPKDSDEAFAFLKYFAIEVPKKYRNQYVSRLRSIQSFDEALALHNEISQSFKFYISTLGNKPSKDELAKHTIKKLKEIRQEPYEEEEEDQFSGKSKSAPKPTTSQIYYFSSIPELSAIVESASKETRESVMTKYTSKRFFMDAKEFNKKVFEGVHMKEFFNTSGRMGLFVEIAINAIIAELQPGFKDLRIEDQFIQRDYLYHLAINDDRAKFERCIEHAYSLDGLKAFANLLGLDLSLIKQKGAIENSLYIKLKEYHQALGPIYSSSSSSSSSSPSGVVEPSVAAAAAKPSISSPVIKISLPKPMAIEPDEDEGKQPAIQQPQQKPQLIRAMSVESDEDEPAPRVAASPAISSQPPRLIRAMSVEPDSYDESIVITHPNQVQESLQCKKASEAAVRRSNQDDVIVRKQEGISSQNHTDVYICSPKTSPRKDQVLSFLQSISKPSSPTTSQQVSRAPSPSPILAPIAQPARAPSPLPSPRLAAVVQPARVPSLPPSPRLVRAPSPRPAAIVQPARVPSLPPSPRLVRAPSPRPAAIVQPARVPSPPPSPRPARVPSPRPAAVVQPARVPSLPPSPRPAAVVQPARVPSISIAAPSLVQKGISISPGIPVSSERPKFFESLGEQNCGNIANNEYKCGADQYCDIKDISNPSLNKCLPKTESFTINDRTYVGKAEQIRRLRELLAKARQEVGPRLQYSPVSRPIQVPPAEPKSLVQQPVRAPSPTVDYDSDEDLLADSDDESEEEESEEESSSDEEDIPEVLPGSIKIKQNRPILESGADLDDILFEKQTNLQRLRTVQDKYTNRLQQLIQGCNQQKMLYDRIIGEIFIEPQVIPIEQKQVKPPVQKPSSMQVEEEEEEIQLPVKKPSAMQVEEEEEEIQLPVKKPSAMQVEEEEDSSTLEALRVAEEERVKQARLEALRVAEEQRAKKARIAEEEARAKQARLAEEERDKQARLEALRVAEEERARQIKLAKDEKVKQARLESLRLAEQKKKKLEEEEKKKAILRIAEEERLRQEALRKERVKQVKNKFKILARKALITERIRRLEQDRQNKLLEEEASRLAEQARIEQEKAMEAEREKKRVAQEAKAAIQLEKQRRLQQERERLEQEKIQHLRNLEILRKISAEATKAVEEKKRLEEQQAKLKEESIKALSIQDETKDAGLVQQLDIIEQQEDELENRKRELLQDISNMLGVDSSTFVDQQTSSLIAEEEGRIRDEIRLTQQLDTIQQGGLLQDIAASLGVDPMTLTGDYISSIVQGEESRIREALLQLQQQDFEVEGKEEAASAQLIPIERDVLISTQAAGPSVSYWDSQGPGTPLGTPPLSPRQADLVKAFRDAADLKKVKQEKSEEVIYQPDYPVQLGIVPPLTLLKTKSKFYLDFDPDVLPMFKEKSSRDLVQRAIRNLPK